MRTSVCCAILPIAGLSWDIGRYGLEPFDLTVSAVLMTLGIGMILFRRTLTRRGVDYEQRSEFHGFLRRFTLSLGFRPPEPGRYRGTLVLLYGCMLLMAGLGLLIMSLTR